MNIAHLNIQLELNIQLYLNDINWNFHLSDYTDFENFLQLHYKQIDYACPFVKISIKASKRTDKWITKPILEDREILKWYNHALLSDTLNKRLKNEFALFHKYYNKLVTDTKQKYFFRFDNSDNIMKSSWSAVNSQIGKNVEQFYEYTIQYC